MIFHGNLSPTIHLGTLQADTYTGDPIRIAHVTLMATVWQIPAQMRSSSVPGSR
jgi:hypothetical protein